MKLKKVQVKNFRSIEDSGVFEIGDLTCLVGKNEAGKTAILRAIHGIDPIDTFSYDRTRDYPRRFLSKFDEHHPNGKSEVAITSWDLDTEDIAAVEALLGEGILISHEVKITSYFGLKGGAWTVPIDEKNACRTL